MNAEKRREWERGGGEGEVVWRQKNVSGESQYSFFVKSWDYKFT